MSKLPTQGKFRPGQGYYAYGALAVATMLPPAFAMNGKAWAVCLYLSGYVAFLLLGSEGFRKLRVVPWMIASSGLYLVVMLNELMKLQFRPQLEIAYVVYVTVLMVSTLVILRKSYLAGDFDP